MKHKILITGDYSHRDFNSLVTDTDSFYQVPFNEALHRMDWQATDVSLVVIAQSFPGQFSPQEIERLQSRYPLIPVVAVLGSWCEGETRSGQPWPGVFRIYWHQWLGRLDLFRSQMEAADISVWHEPQTSSVADRLLRMDAPQELPAPHQRKVGISAHASAQAELLQDVFRELGFRAFWIELAQEQQPKSEKLDLICIDATHLGQELKSRVDWLNNQYPSTPQMVVCNFPREQEVQKLRSWNISRIVSKPFELHDLEYAAKSLLSAEPI